MNTEYESDQDDPVIRWMPRIALLVTIVYGLGWIWVGGTDATKLYAVGGGALVAILWIANGWIISDRRRKK
ncbi:hypothetical protein CZ771_01805 [Actinomycetales bacterium JB111]|nr:hypothetical protein CZ771_01805 [Actinomycetales bacterium JB111]